MAPASSGSFVVEYLRQLDFDLNEIGLLRHDSVNVLVCPRVLVDESSGSLVEPRLAFHQSCQPFGVETLLGLGARHGTPGTTP